nr:hypothetical protein CPGR_03269 [Mycolicibacterium malmesburyense]
MAPIVGTSSRGRNSHPVNRRPSRATTVSRVGSGAIGPELGSRSTGSHTPVRGSTNSTVGGVDGPSTVIASIDPPALMLSWLATIPGSEIRSRTVLSPSSRICNSLAPWMFHSIATVDRSSLTVNSSSS